MKHVLFILLSVAGASGSTQAQLVVYGCRQTNMYGVAYNNGQRRTFSEIDQAARADCERNGGTNCVVIVSSEYAENYAAILTGKTGQGDTTLVIYNKKTSEEAAAGIKQLYDDVGGTDKKHIRAQIYFVQRRREK